MRTALVAGLVVAGLAASAGAQTGTLDQSSPRSNAWYNEDASFLLWQQQIRAGVSGQLEGITLTLSGPAGSQFNVRVRKGPAWSTEPTLFETLLTNALGGQQEVFVDMTAANIQLGSGEIFVMETVGNDTGGGLIGNYVDPAVGPPEYPEPLWLNQSIFSPGWRHGFDTYMLAEDECYPDCDEDGVLSIDDFICFQTLFAFEDKYADCDGDGALSIDDFICFQTLFAIGCE